MAAACAPSSPEAPAPIHYDRDTCGGCGMVISDARFAAEVRSERSGRWVKFDDLGCAVGWLTRHPEEPSSASVSVVAFAGGGWLDARKAHFREGRASPMGFGFEAVDPAEPGLDFDGVRRRLTDLAARRDERRTP